MRIELIAKRGDITMTTEEFTKILDKGETDTVEFKSWIKAVKPQIISGDFRRLFKAETPVTFCG